MIKSEILKLFPEPIFKYKIEDHKDINKKLSEYIYNLKNNDDEGLKRSNKGGWHSKNFELKDKKLNTISIRH